MYALIQCGGQQHKVEPGRYITVNRLAAAEGESITIDEVLLVRTDDEVAVGTPTVDGASVTGTIRRHLRGKKIRGYKYKAKKGYARRWGARADLTQILIESISFGGRTHEAEAAEPEDADEAVESAAPEAEANAAEAEAELVAAGDEEA